MATPRKRLPYAAGILRDQAVMEITSARGRLKPLMTKKTDLETITRVGLALDDLNQAMFKLKEIEVQTEEER